MTFTSIFLAVTLGIIAAPLVAFSLYTVLALGFQLVLAAYHAAVNMALWVEHKRLDSTFFVGLAFVVAILALTISYMAGAF